MQVGGNFKVKLLVVPETVGWTHRGKMTVPVAQTQQSLNYLVQGRWLLLEKKEIEPSGQQQVAVAEGIALPRVFATLIEYSPPKTIPVDSEAVGGSIEERFSR